MFNYYHSITSNSWYPARFLEKEEINRNIRDIKLKVLTDEYDFSINENILGMYKNELNFIYEKFDKYNVVITGSLALKIYGLIDRIVGDIDLLINDMNGIEIKPLINHYDNDELYFGSNIYKNRINLFKVDKYKVDFFKNDSLNSEFIYRNRVYKIDDPINIIEKKANMLLNARSFDTKSKNDSDLRLIFSNI